MADNLSQPLTDHPTDEQWLSIGDAATRLGVSRDTLRRWEKVGKIKVYRSPTNRRIYKQSELEAVYKQYRQGGTPTTPVAKTPSPSPVGGFTSGEPSRPMNPPTLPDPAPTSPASPAAIDLPAPEITSLSPSSLSTPSPSISQTSPPAVPTPDSTLPPEPKRIHDSTYAEETKETIEEEKADENEEENQQHHKSLPTVPTATTYTPPTTPTISSPYLMASQTSPLSTSPVINTPPPQALASPLQPSSPSPSVLTQTTDITSPRTASEGPKQTQTLKLIAIGLIILLIILGIVITVLVVI